MSKSFGTMSDVIDRIQREVETRFASGRKVGGEALRAMTKDFHETISAELRPLRSRINFRKPTATRPKGEAYEMLYLLMAPEQEPHETRSRFFRLVTLHVVASRKKVVMETMPTALGVREHAAHRLIGRGVNTLSAIRNLGDSLADWAALPGLCEAPLLEIGCERLAIPGCRGLMLGHVDPSASISAGSRMTIGRDATVCEDIPLPLSFPYGYSVDTYIGQNEIQPNQAFAATLLDEWRKGTSAAFASASEAVYWPRMELAERVEVPFGDEAIVEIEDLVTQPRMLRAMGNGLREKVKRDPFDGIHLTIEDFQQDTVAEEVQAPACPAL